MHKEYQQFACSEENMPEYFLDIIQHVIKRINHGTVCDLGSHAIGHYWAMGYIERVQSYSCYDLSGEAIKLFNETMKNWQYGDLMKKYPIHMNRLYKHNIIQQPPEEIERQLLEKLDTVKVFDFLNDAPDKRYDTVFANESLEIVDSYEDLTIALKTAYDFLKDDGLFLATSCPYNKETESIKKMQHYKIEGRLSPPDDVFVLAMAQVGFKNIEVLNAPIHNSEDYHQLNVFTAKR